MTNLMQRVGDMTIDELIRLRDGTQKTRDSLKNQIHVLSIDLARATPASLDSDVLIVRNILTACEAMYDECVERLKFYEDRIASVAYINTLTFTRNQAA